MRPIDESDLVWTVAAIVMWGLGIFVGLQFR